MELAFTQIGQGSSGVPIILLHGFPLDRRVFAPVLEHIKNRHIITLDLPGFGESKTKPFTTMAEAAQAVRSFLQAKGLLPCILGGLSMGGYVALTYERLYPQDLKGLLLIDTKAAGDTDEAKENRNRMATVAKEKGSPAVAAMMQPKMLAPAIQEQHPEINTHLLQIMTACPPETIAAACHAMRDRSDFMGTLSDISVPIRVITGEHDAITPPAVGREVARLAKLGSFIEIKGAGHISTLEDPKAVAEAISEFGR